MRHPLALCALLVLALAQLGATPATEELLVGFEAGVTESKAQGIYRRHLASDVEWLSGLNVHRVRIPRGNATSIIARLKTHGEVLFAERNERLALTLTPNDPLFASQYHHGTIGSATAWNTTTGGAVVIAILDTGVNGSHGDLAANMVAGRNIFSGNTDTTDVHGHGTRVAGVAAAVGNNAAQVAGVAFAARIMPVRITDSTGFATTSNVVSGITWAADNGAKVINISIGGVAGSDAVKSAAQYARGKGAVVIAGSGNCSCVDPTAANPYIVSVGATTSTDALASYSSRGAYVDLVAPGSGILTTDRSGGTATVSGTSYSGPVVAGVAALMRAAKPALPVSELESLLLSTALDLGTAGYDQSFGWGRVRSSNAVAAAVASGSTTDVTNPAVSITAPAPSATLVGTALVQISATDAGGIQSVRLKVDGNLVCTDVASPYTCSLDTRTLTNASHTLVAEATDTAGNLGTSSAVNVTVANDLTPPTVALTSLSLTNRTLTVTATAADAGGIAKVELLIDGLLKATDTTAPYSFSVNAKSIKRGSHTASVRATDVAGNTTTSGTTAFTK